MHWGIFLSYSGSGHFYYIIVLVNFIILTYRVCVCVCFNTATVRFDKKRTKKNKKIIIIIIKASATTSARPKKISYIEHLLKYLQPIEDLVGEVFLKIFVI
jgi:hypothetical protein